MWRVSLRALAALSVVLLLAAACAPEGSPEGIAGPRTTGPSDDGKIDPDAGSDRDDDRGAGDLDPEAVTEAALDDIERFWREAYPEVYGAPFEPLAGGYHPYGPRTKVPPCQPGMTYEDIADNAFYCPAADLIAWDLPGLVEPLYDAFGAFTIGIVMAHEFGHAVQQRAGVQGATIMVELQADCFAGAWTAHVDAGRSSRFEVSLADLDLAVAGLLELRDTLGTSASDPLAHGTGFDRVTAFQDGFEHGVERCASYPEDFRNGDLVIVEIPFTSQADFANEGNLDLPTLLPLTLTNLDAFYGQLLAEQGAEWPPLGDAVLLYDPATDEVSCGDRTFSEEEAERGSFYCVPDDVVGLDMANLGRALYEIGDFALVTELARLYALRAQELTGVDGSEAEELLHADCVTGVYAAATFLGTIDVTDEDRLSLSPGDLDEAIIAFLAYGAEGTRSGAASERGSGRSVPSAFERTDAFKDGFMDGITACDALVR